MSCCTWLKAEFNVLFVPLDNRPACMHFPDLIAKMGDIKVTMPPEELLGCFLTPGQPEAILDWIEKQPGERFDALVVSMDMIAYGGLVASRTDSASYEQALKRLECFAEVRKFFGTLPVYGFSTIMRLAPTATPQNIGFYSAIVDFLSLEDEYQKTKNEGLLVQLKEAESKIPSGCISLIKQHRERNQGIQHKLLELVQDGALNYLVLGQDDAKEYGPHKNEIKQLKERCNQLGLNEDKVYYGQGTDQFGSVLISRAFLDHSNYHPKIKVTFSDDEDANKIAKYEARPLRQGVIDQIVTSGAIPIDEGCDYELFVNVPDVDSKKRDEFLERLFNEAEANKPIALADANLDYKNSDGFGDTQAGDIAIFRELCERHIMLQPHFLSYAAWNTAGNTIGTTVPAANIFYVAQKLNPKSKTIQANHAKFVVHRMFDDHAYHIYTRQVVRQKALALNVSYHGLESQDHIAMQDLVHEDLSKHANQLFDQYVKGHEFESDNTRYRIERLENLQTSLPWPRVFEARIDFDLGAEEIKQQ